MREIRFRGKRIDSGEWVYGNLVYVCDGETLHRHPNIVISYNINTFDWIDVLPESVGEFTGLKDMNGKEIFEGDKLKSINTLSGNDFGKIFIMQWSDNKSGWELFLEGHQEIWCFATELYEIIGNIYEKQG